MAHALAFPRRAGIPPRRHPGPLPRDAGRGVHRGMDQGRAAELGDGRGQELSHSRSRGRRIPGRPQCVQPHLHRLGHVRHQRDFDLEKSEVGAGLRHGPLRRQPDRAPVSGKLLLRIRALGGTELLGVAGVFPPGELSVGDRRRDIEALHQRLCHHDHRRQLRGRGPVPDVQPAARGRRRDAGVLAGAGRRPALSAHRLQPSRLRRPVQGRVPEPPSACGSASPSAPSRPTRAFLPEFTSKREASTTT